MLAGYREEYLVLGGTGHLKREGVNRKCGGGVGQGQTSCENDLTVESRRPRAVRGIRPQYIHFW